MKEWMKPLYIGYLQALDLSHNLFPFPRTVQLKISLGPIRFLYTKFHGLLKLIFHTNQYNGAEQQCTNTAISAQNTDDLLLSSETVNDNCNPKIPGKLRKFLHFT